MEAPIKRELSIIVPVVNEAEALPGFLENLSGQSDVDFEVILCDGGSSDETRAVIEEKAKCLRFPLKLVVGERGRGRQMNMGAGVAEGEFLLFLHADSLYEDEYALRKGIDVLSSDMNFNGGDLVAGRFALRFRRLTGRFPMLYFYHESKARLNRAGCIHGDQGFLMPRSLFFSAGPFDESIPVLEDTRFADHLRDMGRWILLPHAIHTSARRFESEGPVRREVLNAVVMTLEATGRDRFLGEMPHMYTSQDRTARLDLYPYFSRLRGLLRGLDAAGRIGFWYACGSYAAANAWQLAFLLDVRRNYRHGGHPASGNNPWLDRYDKYTGCFIGSLPGKIVAAFFVWLFSQIFLFCYYCREALSRAKARNRSSRFRVCL